QHRASRRSRDLPVDEKVAQLPAAAQAEWLEAIAPFRRSHPQLAGDRGRIDEHHLRLLRPRRRGCRPRRLQVEPGLRNLDAPGNWQRTREDGGERISRAGTEPEAGAWIEIQ